MDVRSGPMNRPRRIAVAWVLVCAVVAAGWYGYTHRVALKERFFEKRDPVPVALNRDEVVDRATNAPTPVQTDGGVNANLSSNTNAGDAALPNEANLKVPFTTQAPKVVWDEEHEEFCEEASVLMVARYWQDRTIKDTTDAEEALQQIKTWEVETLGFYKDTTAEETARILREFYGFSDVDVRYDPAVVDIKREVARGNPVIVPAAGRMLGNPNFKTPGPLYHMLVVKGYTKDGKFITNDPGTRKGADYVYDADVIMKAMHDWNGGDVANGRKVMVVVRETNP